MQPVQITPTGLDFRAGATDGSTIMLVNMVDDDGLRPLEAPSVVASSTRQLLTVHSNVGYRYYITVEITYQPTVDKTALSFYFSPDGSDSKAKNLDTIVVPGLVDISSISCVALGNTLVINSSAAHFATRYYLYAIEDQNYRPLGSKPPMVNINFGLRLGEYRSERQWHDFAMGNVISLDSSPAFPVIMQQTATYVGGRTTLFGDIDFENIKFQGNNSASTQREEIVNELTEMAMALIAKSRAEVTDKNHFCMPFFVRYCYELWDGSQIMHSAPVLMVPNSYAAPVVKITDGSWKDGKARMEFEAQLATAQLVAFLDTLPADIVQWRDIVKKIKIGISAQFPAYDQNGKCYGWQWTKNRPGIAIGAKVTDNRAFEMKNLSTFFDDEGALYSVRMPMKDALTYRTSISENALFYEIAEIALEDYSKLGGSVTIQAQVQGDSAAATVWSLANLVNRPRLADDYFSHYDRSADNLTVYNGRLNAAGLSLRPVCDFRVGDMFALCDFRATEQPELYFRLVKQGVTVYVKAATAGPYIGAAPLWLYFPDPDAREAIFVASGLAHHIPLQEHKGLNGAFWFSDFEIGAFAAYPADYNIPDPLLLTPQWIPYPTTLAQSEPYMPFVFKAAGETTIGVGSILAVAAATKALSPGQFGAFPLYAFTDGGVFALSVNDDGTFASPTPVSYDTIVPGTQPLQTDNAVVFVTYRGVMLLQGSESVCISEPIRRPSAARFVPAADSLLVRIGAYKADLSALCSFMPGSDVRLAFDYARQRIFVSVGQVSFVYSLTSQSWSTALLSFERCVNAYPYCYISSSKVGSRFELRQLGDTASAQVFSQGLFLTGRITCGTDSLRTLRAVSVRASSSADSLFIAASDSTNLYLPLTHRAGALEVFGLSGSPYRAHLVGATFTRMDATTHVDYMLLECEAKPATHF